MRYNEWRWMVTTLSEILSDPMHNIRVQCLNNTRIGIEYQQKAKSFIDKADHVKPDVLGLTFQAQKIHGYTDLARDALRISKNKQYAAEEIALEHLDDVCDMIANKGTE